MQVLRHTDSARIRMDFLVHTDRSCAYDEEVQALGARILRCPGHRQLLAVLRAALLRSSGGSRPVRRSAQPRALLQRLRPGCGQARGSPRANRAQSHDRLPYRSAAAPVSTTLPLAGVPSDPCERDARAGRQRARGDGAVRSTLALRRPLDGPVLRDRLGTISRAGRSICGSHERGDSLGRSGSRSCRSVRSRQEPRLPPAGRRRGGSNRAPYSAPAHWRRAASLARVAVRACPRVGGPRHSDGPRSDVPHLLLGTGDAFLLPSLHEGLGLAAVEAQAAGLPAVIADTVPSDVQVVHSLVHRLSLTAPPGDWARYAIPLARQRQPVPDALAQIVASPFSIERSVSSLQTLYLEAVSRFRTPSLHSALSR